jgi:hypothetical protein
MGMLMSDVRRENLAFGPQVVHECWLVWPMCIHAFWNKTTDPPLNLAIGAINQQHIQYIGEKRKKENA